MPVKKYKRPTDGRWVVDVHCQKCKAIIQTRHDYYKARRDTGRPIYCASCACRRTRCEKTINLDLEEWQLAYLAGFMDGEGCLTWCGTSSTPQLTISQVDKRPLVHIAGWLGKGEFTFDRRSQQNKNWSDCWRYRLTNVIDILCLLVKLHKYLLVKTEWLVDVVEYLSRRVDLNGYEGELEYACKILSEAA